MQLKVIFSDGSQGMIKTSRLVEYIKMGVIAAYKPFEDWVELRRKRDDVCMGADRRVKILH